MRALAPSLQSSEVIEGIPAHVPRWTNHSESDPGVTLLELFAFTIENLAYRVERDLPSQLLGADFDPEAESTQDLVACLLLDAAWLARYANDIHEKDWLTEQGIDDEWACAPLRAAATVHAIPTPGSLALLAMGLVLVTLRRRARR